MTRTATDGPAPPALPRWLTAAALAWIAVQVLLPPAIVLAADHLPTVFAWQMFSRGTPRVEFHVLTDDGRVTLYSPRDLVFKDRGDIPFADLLPAKLCQRAGVRAVRTETPDGERVLRCD